MKKKWRVGTLSMGLLLILSGLSLLLLKWDEHRLAEFIFIWWPIIFILLGLEIIVYLFVHKNQESVLRYDIISILFVGFFGFICMGTMLLTSTGIIQEIRYVVHAEERSIDFNEIDTEVSNEVTRIVVYADSLGLDKIYVSAASSSNVHIMGNYRALFLNDQEEQDISFNGYKDNAVSIRTVGNTMYIHLKEPPKKHGIDSISPRVNWTLILPEHINVYLEAGYNQIIMDENVPENWDISSAIH